MPVHTQDSSRARHRVALLIETSTRYGRDLIFGVHDWMTDGARWSIRVAEQARPGTVPPWLHTWRPDGIIARVDTPEVAALLRRLRLPVVDVSAERLRSEFPRVSVDNDSVSKLALHHFTEKGIRNLAFCGDTRFLWSDQRGRAFIRAAAAAGLVCDAFGISRTRKRSAKTVDDLEAIGRWLRKLPLPTGIFVCYDRRAQQVLGLCQQLGLRVPEQISVLGVDNDEVLCELCDPPLSSILPNARRSGYEAASILSGLMAGESATGKRTLAIEPLRVVERQSTDAIAVDDQRMAAALRYIREHGCEGMRVPELLRAVGMSRTLFERKFKATFSQTPRAMILMLRIKRVQQLLVETDFQVARIADLAGFDSPSYLSSAFFRETGMSPLAYRNRHRSGRLFK